MFVRSSKKSNLIKSSLCCCESDGGRELTLSTKTNLFESEIFHPSQRSGMFSDHSELAASPVETILAEVDILEMESKIFGSVMEYWHRLCTEQTLVRTSVSLQTLHVFILFIFKPPIKFEQAYCWLLVMKM